MIFLTVNKEDICAAIAQLGLAGKVLCIHASYKSFGSIHGGITALIEPFLENGCTLLVPTFTYMYGLPLSSGRRIEQNGCDDRLAEPLSETGVFDPGSNRISQEMGAIPAHVLQIAGRVRGVHPLNSFTAIGTNAQELIEAQGYLQVYGPYQKIYQEKDAALILMGVDLTKATPVHFAEQMAGRRLLRRWANDPRGETCEVAVGSCSDGFNNLERYVQGIERRRIVGGSHWRIYPFREFVASLAAAIRQDNMITHCANPNCLRCNDTVKGGPIV